MTVPQEESQRMSLLTVDFESFYDKDYGFKSHTTEEYVRDDRFEVIGVAVKRNDEPTQWCSGTRAEVSAFLNQYAWGESFVLAHNTMFDGAVLAWHFGIKPKAWLDTLSMARAAHGVEAGNSLAKLAEYYNIGVKGDEVINAKGLRRADFTPEQLARYGVYCVNDVELTYKLFDIMKASFATPELKLIDLTLRMFIDPVLRLDLPLLEQHLQDVIAKKEELLASSNLDRKTLMSNPQFAKVLEALGVPPPTKTSLTTGKQTFAFSKTDEAFKQLLNHDDPRVQTVVAARLGTKSTLEETRTERLIGIAKRGSLPVPLRYYAAHTGRWGGDDKLNLQNLPRKSPLKYALIAPKGYVIVDADSSQIEARTLAWLSGQNDLVDAFEKGEDVYRIMAAKIYNKPLQEISDAERFVGKTTILGAGYGMGHIKFRAQLKNFNVDLPEDLCRHILRTYRDSYPFIPALWDEASRCLDALASPQLKTFTFGKQAQAIKLLPGIGFDLPSGMLLRYNDLQREAASFNGTPQYMYMTRRGPVRIYGGKVVENVCQALARCVVGEQMMRIAKRYRVVLTVHDAVACIAKEEERDDAIRYMDECMRWRPTWAQTLPLACEIGAGTSYGDCGDKKSLKKWGLA